MRLTAPGFPDLDLTSQAVLMGVVNVTPDSFSDGGSIATTLHAATRALAMARDGARLIDVGPESTRPGAPRIDTDEQIRRAIEPIRAIRTVLDDAGFQHVWISIDTTRALVARAALDAGACFLNDVSAGQDDPAMLRLAAEKRVPICLMHKQGEPEHMQEQPHYDNVVQDVLTYLRQRTRAAESAGVPQSQILLDPGIGFGKTLEHNRALLQALTQWAPDFAEQNQPLLVGVSRKGLIRALSPDTGTDTPTGRLPGTLALTTYLALTGVRIIRVHDVRENQQALDIAHALGQNDLQSG